MSDSKFTFNFNAPVGQNIANVENMTVNLGKDGQIQVMNAENIGSKKEHIDDSAPKVSAKQLEVEPITDTKDNHIRLFKEAMMSIQEMMYSEITNEPNIKNAYDWCAIFRLATDIGIVASFDEFLQIMNGDGWRKKPQIPQNFQNYSSAIHKNNKYPNWQSGNGYEDLFKKFHQIANLTYSIYKTKCEQAQIEPYK